MRVIGEIDTVCRVLDVESKMNMEVNDDTILEYS